MKEEKFEKLRKLLIQAKKIQEEKIHRNVFNKILSRYNEVVEISYQLIPKINETKRLRKTIDSYRSLDNEPKIKFEPIDKRIKNLMEKKQSIEKKESSIFSLKKKIESYAVLEENSKETKEKIDKMESSVSIMKKKLKVCPVCNKRW